MVRATMNNTPGSVAISIDIAASIDKTHAMTLAIDSLKKMMRKRRRLCVLFTQCAKTNVAREFWSGKLSKSKKASVMVCLFAHFDKRYQIFIDSEDMALFYM